MTNIAVFEVRKGPREVTIGPQRPLGPFLELKCYLMEAFFSQRPWYFLVLRCFERARVGHLKGNNRALIGTNRALIGTNKH